MILLGAIGLLFIIFAPAIVGVFISDPGPTHYGVSCLRIVSTGFLFYSYGRVLTQSFNGASDTWTPAIINLFHLWLLELHWRTRWPIHLGLKREEYSSP